MAKMASLKSLLLTLVVFAIGLSSTLVGPVFADDQDGRYSHQHITALWDHGLVCGDHRCSPGQAPQYPAPVVPIRGH